MKIFACSSIIPLHQQQARNRNDFLCFPRPQVCSVFVVWLMLSTLSGKAAGGRVGVLIGVDNLVRPDDS